MIEWLQSLDPETIKLLWVALGGVALLGAPLFSVLAGVAILAHAQHGLRLAVIFTEASTIIDQSVFVTIPLFVFAGTLLSESRAPARLVGLARALLGWLPGGLAIVATVTCAFFTAVTGASGVTIVALGGLLYPVLSKDDYPDGFSVGLLTTGGSLGLLFAPSLPIVVYGVIAGVDIDRLFLAGIVPGLLLIAAISAYSIFIGRRGKVARHTPPWKDPAGVGRSLVGAVWEAPIPFLILFGLFNTWKPITAIEASALTALYCLFVEVVVYRDVKLSALPGVLRRAAELVGAILVILAMAMGVKNYLIDAEIPQQILASMSAHIDSRLTFLLVLNVFLLITGCLLDIFSAILAVVPLIAPLATQFGVDPVHLAIVFLTNLEIGYLTPPVGINLFLGSLRFKRPVLSVAKSVLPFLFVLLVCLGAITYVPALSTGLVDLMKGAPSTDAADEIKENEHRVYERWVGRDGREIPHGAYEAFYLVPEGQPEPIKERGFYRHSNRHTVDREGAEGVWTTFRRDGSKEKEGPYRFGKRHGEWTEWNEDGTPKSKGTYVNGVREGEWREWVDGYPDYTGHWKDDLRHGPWIDWWDVDLKASEGRYEQGKLVGRWRNWDEDGLELPTVIWKDGVKVGEEPPKP